MDSSLHFKEEEWEGTLHRLLHRQKWVLRSFNSLANSDQLSEMPGRMILSQPLGLAGENVVILNLCCGQGNGKFPTSA